MAFTVTATEGGATSNGIALNVQVMTGAAVTQPGTIASQFSVTPNMSITPAASGSYILASILLLQGTITAVSGTTVLSDDHATGLEYVAARSTGTTTGGTPQTVGVTSLVNGISVCLAEILASGTLAFDASSPGDTLAAAAITVTSAAFTPPNTALLVAMAESNGNVGTTTMSITDTSGLGLTWTERVKKNGGGNGYSGIWTANMPGLVPPVPPAASGGGRSLLATSMRFADL